MSYTIYNYLHKYFSIIKVIYSNQYSYLNMLKIKKIFSYHFFITDKNYKTFLFRKCYIPMKY